MSTSHKKICFGKKSFIYPVPAVLVGVLSEGKVNYTMLGNCGIMSVNPAIVYISSEKEHYLNQGVHENGCFSINIPSVAQMKQADYCGTVSGKQKDKSKVFETCFEKTGKIPLIQECPVNLACNVIQTIQLQNMEIFIAEVEETYVSEECLTEGKPDTGKINPLIYAMDNQYWELGNAVEKGFSEGKEWLQDFNHIC